MNIDNDEEEALPTGITPTATTTPPAPTPTPTPLLDDNSKVDVVEESSNHHNSSSSCCPCCCFYTMSICFCLLVALVIPIAIGVTRGFGVDSALPDVFIVDASTGYPVWSDTGKSIAGIKEVWNEGIQFPPMNGEWKGPINPRFTVFILQNITQDPTNNIRTDLVTIDQYAISLYYMETAGYILVNYLTQPQELRGSKLISIQQHDDDGSTTVTTKTSNILSNEGLGMKRGIYHAIPSRDGSIIVAIAHQTEYERSPNVEYFAYDIDFRVAFINVTTMIMTTPNYITFRGTVGLYENQRQWPFYYWDDEDEEDGDGSSTLAVFRMTDLQGFSVAIYTNGTVLETHDTIPPCIPFATESGPIRASDGTGLVVDAARGQILSASTTSNGGATTFDVNPYCGTNNNTVRSMQWQELPGKERGANEKKNHHHI